MLRNMAQASPGGNVLKAEELGMRVVEIRRRDVIHKHRLDSVDMLESTSME
jgi:hypothetical protein